MYIWEHTEQKLDELLAENAALRERLEPIERVWKTGEDYMLYDAVKECMEMKEGG